MNAYNLVSLAGFFILLGLAWLASSRRRRVKPRTIIAGILIQFCFALFIFMLPVGSRFFLLMSKGVVKLLDASRAGSEFCFGPLAIPPGLEGSIGFILTFQGLVSVVFFASLMQILYYIGVMPLLLRGFSRLFTRTMGISGAESMCATSNIFVGIESATTVRPFLARMTRSELCTILTAGLATIASSILGLYVLMLNNVFPNIAGHLISASLLSAPAAIIASKLLLPETDTPETLGQHVDPRYEREGNLLEAAINGAMAGGKLVMSIIALLLAFLGLVALANIILGLLGHPINTWLGTSINWQLQELIGWLFYPFALLIGVPPTDAPEVAHLLGMRTIMTEVAAYNELATMMTNGSFVYPRSPVLASYALCGFTHVASIAIFVGGISALAPGQTRTLSQIAWRAFLAATLACLLTAAMAGIFYGQGTLLLTQ
jgi:CNT family concentrative nucleoside transporter